MAKITVETFDFILCSFYTFSFYFILFFCFNKTTPNIYKFNIKIEEENSIIIEQANVALNSTHFIIYLIDLIFILYLDFDDRLCDVYFV